MTVTSATNVANLQLLSGPFSPGDAVILDGYFAAGDLGGGLLYFEGGPPTSAMVTGAAGVTSTITGATNTSPISITTSAAHGYVCGQVVVIQNVGGNTAANGTWTITVTGSTTFTLDDSSWTGGTYTSGGTSKTITITTSTAHGFVSGQQVMVAGVVGMTEANGTWTATVLTTTTFSIGQVSTHTYTSGGIVSDGGMAIPSSAVGGRWLRPKASGLNVQWFGASGGGGDVSPQLAAALNFGARNLLFPPGTYITTRSLTFPSTMSLQFVDGAILNPRNTFATISSPILAASTQQIFSGGMFWSVSQANSTSSPLMAAVSTNGPWNYRLSVKIQGAGDVGTATFQYSLDGGTTWHPPLSPYLATASRYAVPGTGLVLTFPVVGTYAATTTYNWNLGSIGVSSTSGGPSLTISPTTAQGVYADHEFFLRIVLGGALGAATFQYSLDGGTTWLPSTPRRAQSTYVIPGTGVTVGFPSGTYIATAMYGWTTSGPVALTSTATDRFTPCWWGATADGMTDGTAAIQDAVNAVQGTNPGSYTIFFPSGQNAYLVSTGITFAGNLSHAIRFLGEASSELGGAWLAWGGPSNTDGSESQVMLTLSTASGFRFEHMLFSGQLPTNPTPGVTGPQYLVWIRENAYPPGTGSTEHGIFHDCTFQGSYGPGSGCVAIGDRTGGDIAQIVWRECVFQGVFGPLVSGSITGATNAAPIQITTSANHGLSTGSAVLITGVGGNRAANGDWYVVVTGLTTFTLNDSTGSGAYTSGGTFTCAATTEYGIKFNNQVGNNLIFRMSDCQWQIFRRANIKCVSSVASLIIDNPSISNVTGGPPASGLIADWYIGPYIELTILGGRSEGSGRIVYSYPIFDILGSCTIQGHNWNGASIDFSFDPLGEASQAFQDVAIYWTGSLRLIGNRIWNQRGDATHPPNIIVAADPGPIGVVSGLGFDGAIFSQGNHYYNSTFLPFYDGSGGNLLAEWQDFAKAGEASLFSRFDIGGQDGALIRFPSYEGQNSRVGPQQLLVQTSSLASARFSKVNAGILAHSVAKFGVDSTDIQTGSTNMTITLGLLPARARIINVIANTTTTYQGGPVTAVTCSVGGAGTTDYLAAHDVKTAVVTKGLVTGDMGTLLLPSHNNTIGYLPSFSDSSAVTATYISEGANLSALRQGHSDFYITFEVLPH